MRPPSRSTPGPPTGQTGKQRHATDERPGLRHQRRTRRRSGRRATKCPPRPLQPRDADRRPHRAGLGRRPRRSCTRWGRGPSGCSPTRTGRPGEPRRRALFAADPLASRRPVLLVPVSVDNRSIFAVMRRSLRRRGFASVCSWNYSPLLRDVAKAADDLGAHIERICAQTGTTACTWSDTASAGSSPATTSSARAVTGGSTRLVTLGTPHGGSVLAHALPTPLVRQVRPGLDGAEGARRARRPVRHPHHRRLQRPRPAGAPTSAGRCDHPDLGARNVLVRGVGHMSLPIHRGVLDEVALTLAGADTAAPAPAPSRRRLTRPVGRVRSVTWGTPRDTDLMCLVAPSRVVTVRSRRRYPPAAPPLPRRAAYRAFAEHCPGKVRRVPHRCAHAVERPGPEDGATGPHQLAAVASPPVPRPSTTALMPPPQRPRRGRRAPWRRPPRPMRNRRAARSPPPAPPVRRASALRRARARRAAGSRSPPAGARRCGSPPSSPGPWSPAPPRSWVATTSAPTSPRRPRARRRPRGFSGGLEDADVRRGITEAEAQARLGELAASRAARQPKTRCPVGGRADDVLLPALGHHALGLDLAAPLGTPILSASDGVVLRAGRASGYGYAVYIQDADGNVHIYGHMRYYNVSTAPSARRRPDREGRQRGPVHRPAPALPDPPRRHVRAPDGPPGLARRARREGLRPLR